MTKKEFLEKLEKELSILNDKERKDIIEEYKDTIEEKIKHGQSEEDAVKDFGNIEDLVSDILDAYKINPEYKDNNFDKFTQKGEDLIKKGAGKLADMTREFANTIKDNDTEKNLNLAFEIIIKIFCTLIILAILTIPFRIFKNLGYSFAETFFSPFSGLIKIILLLLFIALYFGISLLVIVALFKQYFKKDTIEEKEDTSEKESKKEKKQIKEEKPVKIIKKNGPTIGSVILLIVKIWTVIIILLPLFFLDFMAVLGLFISAFYLIKGINLLGLTLLLLGVSILCIWFTLIIYNLTFSKGKTTIIPFFLGLAISIFGMLFFIDMITNIEYINKAPTSFKKETEIKEYQTDKNVYIDFRLLGKMNKTIDETMPDNTFKLKLTYDKDSTQIDIYNDINHNFTDNECLSLDKSHLCQKPYNYFSISYDYVDGYNNEKQKYNDFINNLKENKVYNYEKLNEINIEIIANTKTMNIIETY